MNRKAANPGRTLTICFASLAGVASLYLAIKYGPQPDPPAQRMNATEDPIPPPVDDMSSNQSSAVFSVADSAIRLFGSYGHLLREGCDPATPTSFADSLEAQYGRRGLHPMNGDRARYRPLQKPVSRPPGSYWRTQADGVVMLGAVGRAAEPNVYVWSAEPQMYLTIGAPSKACGTSWKEYQYFHSAKLNAGGDSSELDADGPPAPPASRSLFHFGDDRSAQRRAVTIYISDETPEKLRVWYAKAMSVQWRHDVVVSTQVSALLKNTLYFTQKGRYCLISVNPSGEGKKAAVIVSLGNTTDIGE